MIATILLYIILLLITYFLYTLIHNLFFHPLRHIPGPKAWAAAKLPFIHSLLRGELIHDLSKLHRHYGPIVRTAPDEVAFAHPEAYTSILQPRSGRERFLKDAKWWSEPNQKSVVLAINPETHARLRRTIAPAFTDRALQAQEPIIARYVELLITSLRERIEVADDGSGGSSRGSAVIDIFPWLNFTTFDIIGDLGFGESFSCLETGGYHPWIALIFNSIKALAFVNAVKYFPAFDWVLKKCVPPSLKKMQDDHFQFVVDKVRRRMGWEVYREDFMSHALRGMKGGGNGGKGEKGGRGMELDEIDNTFVGLTVAGSETTATALAGVLNFLSKDEGVRTLLTRELRERFGGEAEITMGSVKALPYLNAVIEEGLRLCPPVPWILPRTVPAGGDMVCGVWLPGGTTISISQFALNRDPGLFHEASSFRPERWLPEATKLTSPFCNDRRDAVQPFGIGPRGCIGKGLAWGQMRFILARIVWAFDIEEKDGGAIDWEELRTFLLVEKKPIEVRLKVR